MDDAEWEPPSEAELKIIQARRERSDKISKIMGDYLLKGYKMLGDTCPTCQTILLQDKRRLTFCVACSELDSDTTKDDPALNNHAARRQVEEQSQRMTDAPAEDDPFLPSESPITTSITAGVGASNSPQTTVVTDTSAPARVSPLITNTSPVSVTLNNDGFPGKEDAMRVVTSKLSWASHELVTSTSVEYSIQLCKLVKECAECIQTLKHLN